MAITDYSIVMAVSLKGLEKRVKKAFKDGWQPLGSYSTLKRSYGVFYTQTMVKHDIR